MIEVRSETTSSSMIAKNHFTVDATALTLDAAEGPAGHHRYQRQRLLCRFSP